MALFEEHQKKGKGRLIIAFLIAIIFIRLLHVLNEVTYLFSKKVLISTILFAEEEIMAIMSSLLIIIDLILNLAVIVFAIAIWRRKKWGLYALGAYIIVMDIILPVIVGMPILPLIPRLIGLAMYATIAYSLWAEYV